MKLSPEMEKTMAILREHGRLIRHPGGFWLPPGEELKDDGLPAYDQKYYHTNTLEALLRRDLVKCTDEKIGWGGNPYPSEYSLK